MRIAMAMGWLLLSALTSAQTLHILPDDQAHQAAPIFEGRGQEVLHRFAIVSDRTGGHREGVFQKAIDQLNWLRPDFVVSVGDLIEGYIPYRPLIERQWNELESMVEQLHMPFHYLPGNHDYTNQVLADVWHERRGADHYAFVREDVLFLMLNSEEFMRGAGRGRVGPQQYAFVKKQLEAHPEVTWTCVFMHQPLWEQDGTGWWPQIEALLAGRPYTVFAGHRHHYAKHERQDANYYILGSTGGSSRLRGPEFGEFDHVMWVTMTTDGPVIANLMLDGILSDDPAGPAPMDFAQSFLLRQPLRIHPVEKGESDKRQWNLRLFNFEDIRAEVSLELEGIRDGWLRCSANGTALDEWVLEPNSVDDLLLEWEGADDSIPKLSATYHFKPRGGAAVTIPVTVELR